MAYSQKAVNKYREKKYWNMSVTIPKEYKDVIKKAAVARGVSVSRLVADALGRELGIDLALDGVLPYLQGRGDAAQPEEKTD